MNVSKLLSARPIPACQPAVRLRSPRPSVKRTIIKMSSAADNRALVSTAVEELFNKRDTSALSKYFGPTYFQHNPTLPDGLEVLETIIKSLGPDFKYEAGLVVAEGDLVWCHGRYVGWGPKPMVAVDIFRVANGKIVEHWDVMQEEVPAGEAKSQRPMFPIAW